MELGLQIRRSEGSVVLLCSGRIVRGAEGEALERMLVYLLTQNRRVVLDLHNVHTMDCGGLGVIIAKFVEARQCLRSLEFCRVSENVLKIFRVTGLEDVLPIHQKESTATRCACANVADESASALAREQIFESRAGLTVRDILRWLTPPKRRNVGRQPDCAS